MQDVPRLTVVDFRVWLVSTGSWHDILIYRTLVKFKVSGSIHLYSYNTITILLAEHL